WRDSRPRSRRPPPDRDPRPTAISGGATVVRAALPRRRCNWGSRSDDFGRCDDHVGPAPALRMPPQRPMFPRCRGLPWVDWCSPATRDGASKWEGGSERAWKVGFFVAVAVVLLGETIVVGAVSSGSRALLPLGLTVMGLVVGPLARKVE